MLWVIILIPLVKLSCEFAVSQIACMESSCKNHVIKLLGQSTLYIGLLWCTGTQSST